MSDKSVITIGDPPLFCPECHRVPPGGSSGALCGHCGATLAARGYCPICESWLKARPGAACPKHDVELLADPPSASASPSTSWVTVGRFPDTLSASAPRIRLEAEGIPTFVEGECMAAAAGYGVTTCDVKLRVPAELAADARVLLSQGWSWPGELDGDDGPLDDLEEGHPREPTSLRTSFGWLWLAAEILVTLCVLIWLFRRGPHW